MLAGLQSFIDWLRENGKLLADHPLAFIAFGLIEAAILLAVLRLRYSGKLKELPNLSDIKDKLREAQEKNFSLSEENRRLHTENEKLKMEVRALQSDKELLTGMEPRQTVTSMGKKISDALNSR